MQCVNLAGKQLTNCFNYYKLYLYTVKNLVLSNDETRIFLFGCAQKQIITQDDASFKVIFAQKVTRFRGFMQQIYLGNKFMRFLEQRSKVSC